MLNVRKSYMGVQFMANLVWKGTISDGQVQAAEHTLNTRRILLRSNFQAVIASLSLFA